MHLSTKELILCALFIALITVGTFIKMAHCIMKLHT